MKNFAKKFSVENRIPFLANKLKSMHFMKNLAEKFFVENQILKKRAYTKKKQQRHFRLGDHF